MPDATAPVILEVAVNGSTPRSVNPHVPLSPDEVAADMLDAVAGGHVRVELEDHAGDRTPTNRVLVDEAVALLADLGRRPSTPAETRAARGLRRLPAVR